MRSDSKLAGPATGGATGRLRAALGAAGPALVAGMLPLLFIPTTVDAYVLPRASLVLLAGCSAALAGLWLPVSLRPSLGVLGPVALAVAAAALLATILSVAPALSLIGSYGRYESLPMRLAYLLSFCLGVWVLRSRRQRWWTVTAFIVGCLVASLEALNQTRTGIPPRPDGNLGHANLLAALVAMALPLVIARSLRTPLWSLCVVPLGGALVATSSRSGWLGAMAGCVLLFPLLASTGPRRGWALAAAAGSVVAAAAAVIASPLGRLHSDTGSARLHVWSDSLAMIWARPLTGWGPESQGIVLGRFLRGDWEPGATFDRIHQLALDLLATQGMLGLVACSAFWALWAWRCWRCLETAAIPEGER
ncbi:MAG: O-antigen ligase family protein, partial [Candidatus Dormibacteraeota bacterium]|nr:O-antigen ligase family protein [Candidatus Dormibacteraeota bacterium]